MNKLKKHIVLVLLISIVLLGTVLRFYKLGEIPNSLNWDEVSWGYNAYSILETGKDEYGKSFPLSFEAFGDFKQPAYVYLQLPFIIFFGLNAFAVRFPSALLGSISIVFVYLLVCELLANFKNRKTIAFLTALFFAVSPWSIQFSRVAFEANIGLFFVILGAWLFIRGLNTQNKWYLFAACIPFGISAHTYHSEKLFTPLFFGGLLLLGYSFFMKRRKLAVVLILFFVLCNILWLVDPRTTRRGRSVTFMSQQTQILARSTEKIETDTQNSDVIGRLSHNRRFEYATKYIDNYLKHFELNYLFVSGDNGRHHAPGFGILYLVNLPFVILGIILAKKRKVARIWFVFFWLLLAPTASALAVDAPNASRSLIILPTFQIFAAFGWYFSFEYLKKIRFGKLIQALLVLLFLGNFLYYLNQYFTLTNYEYAPYWQDGYKQAVEQTQNTQNQVFFASELEQPYIFYLFYTKYSPQKYQIEGGSSRTKQSCFGIDNAQFGNCLEKAKTGDLIITSKINTSTETKRKSQVIRYPDQTPAIEITEKE